MGISDLASRSSRHHQLLVNYIHYKTLVRVLNTHDRAKMYGQFDPKWLYVLCVLGFEVGSALCGAAPSMNALVVGRAIAGLGGAGLYLGVVMLLSIFTTPTERPVRYHFGY